MSCLTSLLSPWCVLSDVSLAAGLSLPLLVCGLFLYSAPLWCAVVCPVLSPSDCPSPSPPQLEELVPGGGAGGQLPVFLTRCVEYIEAEGLDAEGLYRVPGNRQHVDLLFERLSEDPAASIADLDLAVNAVATALKEFLSKKLPPLLTQEKMAELTSIAGTASSICSM